MSFMNNVKKAWAALTGSDDDHLTGEDPQLIQLRRKVEKDDSFKKQLKAEVNNLQGGTKEKERLVDKTMKNAADIMGLRDEYRLAMKRAANAHRSVEVALEVYADETEDFLEEIQEMRSLSYEEMVEEFATKDRNVLREQMRYGIAVKAGLIVEDPDPTPLTAPQPSAPEPEPAAASIFGPPVPPPSRGGIQFADPDEILSSMTSQTNGRAV